MSEADKGHVCEHVKLLTAHEKGGIPCRTRYDASQGDWLRQSGPGAAAAVVLDPFPKVAVCISILKRLQGNGAHSPAMRVRVQSHK